MWNLRLRELGLSSYCLQMWARTPCPVQLGAPAVRPAAVGLVGSQESAMLKHSPSHLLEPPPLRLHAQPRSIPPGGCKGFNLVEDARALLRLPRPSNELCHDSPHPPPQAALLFQRWRDSKQWKLLQRGETMWAVKGKKSKQKKQFRCWEFRQSLSRKHLALSF